MRTNNNVNSLLETPEGEELNSEVVNVSNANDETHGERTNTGVDANNLTTIVDGVPEGNNSVNTLSSGTRLGDNIDESVELNTEVVYLDTLNEGFVENMVNNKFVGEIAKKTLTESVSFNLLKEDSADGMTTTYIMGDSEGAKAARSINNTVDFNKNLKESLYGEPTVLVDNGAESPLLINDKSTGEKSVLESAYELAFSILDESVESYEQIVNSQEEKLAELRKKMDSAPHHEAAHISRLILKTERRIATNRRKIVVASTHNK